MRASLPDDFLTIPLAHRALHDVAEGRPENSRAAVQAAVEAGYGIEIDVQMSADARAMVFHDDTLERLTDVAGPLRARNADALADIPLRGGAEGIPDLADILALVGGRTPILIEIKDQDGALGPQVGPLEEAVAAALTDYAGPVAVMSFNPHAVLKMAELCPNIPRGLVTEAFGVESWPLPEERRAHLRAIPDYDRAACSFISHNWRDLNRTRVAELKSLGAHVLCWTVKSQSDEAEARKIAQNITFERYRAALPT